MNRNRRTVPSVFRIAVKQLKLLFCKVDFWVVIITLAAFLSIQIGSSERSLAAAGDTIGIFAVFPLLLQDSDPLYLTMIGYLLIISDIPHMHTGIEQQILRTNRAVWFLSQWLYTVLLTLVYYLLMNIACICFFLPQVSLTVDWGSGIYNGTAGGNHMMSIGRGFLGESAWQEWIAISLLVFLVSLLLAGICLICNMYLSHQGVGVLVDAILMFLLLLYETGTGSFGLLSPLELLARFSGDIGAELPDIAGYYIVICAVLFAVGYRNISRAEIRVRE